MVGEVVNWMFTALTSHLRSFVAVCRPVVHRLCSVEKKQVCSKPASPEAALLHTHGSNSVTSELCDE